MDTCELCGEVLLTPQEKKQALCRKCWLELHEEVDDEDNDTDE